MSDLVAKVEMLIRRPVADVFAAVADGEQITKYWLSKTTGPLEEGKTVHWNFMVECAEADATVRKLTPNEHILIEWSDGTTVDWWFTEHPDGTVLRIENKGYAEGAVEEVVESTQGFTIVICDLKTYLESGQSANLARDKAQIIEEQMQGA